MVAIPATIADAPPPPTALPPPPPAAPANPQAEAIASSAYDVGGAYRTYARTLPVASDDLERDFPGIYDRMGTDPHLHSDTLLLIVAALSTPATVQPGVPEGHPQYAKATKAAAFMQANLDRLPRALDQLLKEMGMAALRYGHKLAELVYAVETWDPAVGPQLVIDRIKCKPRRAYNFVQDAYGNPLGVLPRKPGQAASYSATTSTDADGHLTVNGDKVWPMVKFGVLAHDQQDEDIRGQSAYRRLYNAWYMIQQFLPELLSYMARFGQPFVWATNAPNAGEQPKFNTDHTAAAPVNPNQSLLDTLNTLRSGGTWAGAAGQDLHIEQAAGNGEVFFKGLDTFHKWLSKGLLCQTLATMEGDHRSGTDSTTHQDNLGLIVRFTKGWLADFLKKQVIDRLMLFNYGPDSLAWAPSVDLGQTDPHDFAATLQALSQAAGQGYWTNIPPAVGAKLDRRVGIPVRDMSNVGPDGIPGTADDPKPPQTVPPPKPPTTQQARLITDLILLLQQQPAEVPHG